MIRCESLRRAYTSRRGQRVALDGVTFEIARGEFVALLGPNGAGKSTLLRSLCTADLQDSGELWLFGRDPREAGALRDVRGRLGVVFQSISLDPLLTVRENLTLHARLHGAGSREAHAWTERASDRVGITDRLGDRVGTLSGGLARRTDLARAMLHSPELVLLDEPTVGLDHAARASFVESLCELVSTDDAPTVLLSTHHMDEADRAQRVLLMHEGRIVADDPPATLRAETGAWMLTCERGRADREPVELLRSLGLEPMSSANGAARVVLDEDDPSRLAGVVDAVIRAGAAVSVGPPTLGDAYLQRTGAALEREESPA